MQQPAFIVIVICKIQKKSDISYNFPVIIIRNNKYFIIVTFFCCDEHHNLFLNQFIMYLN